jgi:hypothetical protein
MSVDALAICLQSSWFTAAWRFGFSVTWRLYPLHINSLAPSACPPPTSFSAARLVHSVFWGCSSAPSAVPSPTSCSVLMSSDWNWSAVLSLNRSLLDQLHCGTWSPSPCISGPFHLRSTEYDKGIKRLQHSTLFCLQEKNQICATIGFPLTLLFAAYSLLVTSLGDPCLWMTEAS